MEANKDRFSLTPEETKFITETMKKAVTLPDGRDKNILLAEISFLVGKKIPLNARNPIWIITEFPAFEGKNNPIK